MREPSVHTLDELPNSDIAPMKFHAVLFDIDGTLVDSNDMHVIAWQEAFSSVGATFDHRIIHDQIGKGTDMLVPTLLPEADTSLQKKLGKMQGEIFKAKFLPKVRPFASAHELLARVHNAGQRVVLASSASGAEVDHYLGLLDARDLVDATTTADDVANTKPASDIFAVALKKVAVRASKAIVVGDSPYDVEAASKREISAIAVRSGKFSDEALKDAIERHDDVSALLRSYDRSALGVCA